ncbi:MAG: hypothetical protein COT81_00655 [Candidatus Buchananbacteria bacterium CG10_big_fil_rev_8_21_14_0_10_42_9]|uniref:Uncharacterized protein n=1 Tax=Candidatus Buchananbacteria bacterium CG10_big_fil_rev_8_21_14_0_10_42_9 TaxID=1974526 RepID=A0A2H0W4K7_9BACT|nr:MAG: hypothetical protein COT81_00655 [Candidatus Buchananbacteria bacterium CG10_big_fil_rev_8_21_14_0_10_42_9]
MENNRNGIENSTGGFDKESQEINEGIIASNFDKMNTEMFKLLHSESFGGNAGSVEIDGEKYPCAAANGYADAENGQIIEFGNYLDENAAFTLRVAIELSRDGGRGKGFFRIVETIFKGKFSERAEKNLRSSVERWNNETKGSVYETSEE